MAAKKYSHLVSITVFCFFLVAGQILRTYIASGYPFYPLKTFGFLNPDWTVPHKIIDDFVDFTRYYNRVPEEYQAISITRDLGPINWVIPWFRHLSILDKLLVVLSLIGVVKSAGWIRKAHQFNFSEAIPFLFWACFIHLITWLLISPAPRFGYHSLILFSCVALTPLSLQVKHRGLEWILTVALSCCTASLIIYTVNKIYGNEDYRHFVVPVMIPQPPEKTIIISGMLFHIPGITGSNWNPRCYCLPLPCIYEPIPGLIPRGNTPESGFRIKQN